MRKALFLAFVILCSAWSAQARRASSSHPSSTRYYHTRSSKYGASHPRKSSYRRYLRSRAAKKSFESQTGYPHGRPGYVVDHVIPLACGGADDPSNLQWQTVAEGKAKDKWERKGCKR